MNKKLELQNAPLAKQVLEKAGTVIQDELKQKYPNGIDSATIAISSGGNLKNVKNIIYIYVSSWNEPSKDNLKTKYLSILSQAFKEGASRSCKNIALPAIGSGNLGYPRKFVADWIRESIMNFYEKVIGSKTLLKVNVVLYEKDKEIIEAFNLSKETLVKEWNIKDKTSEDVERNEFLKMEIGSVFDESKSYDCLIIATNEKFNLKYGQLTKQLLEKAGTDIQNELLQNYPSGINTDTVAVSSGGDLKGIKCIVLIYIDSWDANDQHNMKKIYQNIIKKALNEAFSRSCKNIAIPAIGSGNLKYPKNIVAKWMHESMVEFMKQYKNKNNSRISVVVYEQDKELIKEFSQIFSNNNQSSGLMRKVFKAVEKYIGFNSGDSSEEKKLSTFFGSINVIVQIGDITNSNQDVIVNPTDDKFNLSGAVSTAILQKGSKELKNLIENRPLRNGILWSAAPNFNCIEILHIDVRSSSIQDTVMKLLKLADERKISSIGLPVIGTSRMQNTNYKEVALQITAAKYAFSKEPNCIKSIVIYVHPSQKELVHYFSEIFESFKSGTTNILNSNNCKLNLEITIISNKKENIIGAKKQIDGLFKKEIISTKSLIYLGVYAIQEIEKISEKNNCICIIEKNKDQIILEGLHDSVLKSKELVNNLILKLLDKHIEERKSMDNFNKTKDIRWEYHCKDSDKWYPFSVFINQIIEMAYLEKKKEVNIIDEYNDERFINLETEQFDDGRSVRRIDLSVHIVSFQLPNTWEPKKFSDLICLDTNSNEYKDALRIFEDKGMKGKYQQIVSIERIQNQALWIQYTAHKDKFIKRDPNTVNEMTLFHGTTADSIENIWKMGFNRSFCGKNATMYGKGVYFALNSKYSHNYTGGRNVTNKKQMFLCKVLIGISALGNSQIESKNLPTTPQGYPVDSTVNDLNQSTIFVVYLDAQAYPEYLISYQ